MIQLQIYNQFLDLPQDVALSIEMQSPIFALDSMVGSISYDFTVPKTAINNRIFLHNNVEVLSPTTNSFPCKIFFNGIVWHEGILRIKRIAENYQCYLNLDTGLIKEALADKDLSELPIEPIEVQDIGSDSTYPYIRLKLANFVSGDRKLLKLNVYRNNTMFTVLKYQYQVFFNTDKATTLADLAFQINNKNSDTHIWPWQTNKKYRIESAWVNYIGWRGQAIKTPVYWRNKYWVGRTFAGIKIGKINSPVNFSLGFDPINFQSYGRGTSFSKVLYSEIDEPIGHYDNGTDLRATVIGPDELLVEDMSNAYPYHLDETGDFGTDWTLEDYYTSPVIQGIDPVKIASFYENTMTVAWPEASFTIGPVRNEEFLSSDEWSEFQKYQNNIDRDGKLILNSNTSGHQNKNVFTAFPFVNFVLTEIFKMADLSLFGEYMEDEDLKTLCIWNNFSNDIVLIDSITPANKLRVPSPSIDLRQNLKGTSIKDFLYAIRQNFGVDFFFRANGLVEMKFKKTIFASTEADDWSKYEIGDVEMEVEDEINGFSFINSFPNDSYSSDLLKDFEDYQIKPDVNTEALLLGIKDDPINTIRGVYTSHTETYVKLYRCTFGDDYQKTWVFFGYRLKNIESGDATTEIKPAIGAPLMFYIDENTTDRPRWRIARIDAEGRSLFQIGELKDPGILAFMFARNSIFQWQNADTSYDYIAGRYLTSIVNASLSSVRLSTANYSLHFGSEPNYEIGSYSSREFYTLYSQFWKLYSELMLQACYRKKRFLLPQLEVMNLDLSRKKYSKGKTFLIDKINFELSNSSKIEATVAYWQL